MQEFLVHFKIAFPPGTPAQVIANLYEAEAKAAAPLLDSGHFRRVWREVGTRNHWALWLAPDADHIHEAYSSFPIWQAGYGVVDQIIPLAHNFNDPGPNRISSTEDWPNIETGEATARLGDGSFAPRTSPTAKRNAACLTHQPHDVHIGWQGHGPYAEHTHEVRPDHLGVERIK